MSEIFKLIFSYHLTRQKLWIITSLTIITAFLTVAGSFFPGPVNTIVENPLLESLVFSFKNKSLETGTFLWQLIYKFNYRVFHYTSLICLLLILIGSPLNRRTILEPVGAATLDNKKIQATEIIASLGIFYSFVILMFLSVQAAAFTSGSAGIYQAVSLLFVPFKLTLLAFLYFFFRFFGNFQLAVTSSVLIYFLAHFRPLFARLSYSGGVLSNYAARGLYIFLPPLGELKILPGISPTVHPLLLGLYSLIIIFWIILLAGLLLIARQKYDLL